jgi:hypothetical protein
MTIPPGEYPLCGRLTRFLSRLKLLDINRIVNPPILPLRFITVIGYNLIRCTAVAD